MLNNSHDFSFNTNHQIPVLLVVMDGFGLARDKSGSAIDAAHKPNFDFLWNNFPHITLKAHGKAVGMPSDDDMGNSEVGHNAIGAGQIYDQGAALVNNAIADESLFLGNSWQEIIGNVKTANKTLHFIGLFSDGNVHSHIEHLKAMVVRSKQDGVKSVRIHILLDGRDVSKTSALDYLLPFEEFLQNLNDNNFDAKIASGGGRQVITMDRYDANWKMVELGWDVHIKGENAPKFESAKIAIETFRQQNPDIIDQDLPPFIIAENDKPVGKINNGDSVVFFNFRGDRAIEISKALEFCEFRKSPQEKFNYFDVGDLMNIKFAGMLQYDGDLQLPKRFLVPPPAIKNTMSQWLSQSNIKQFACAETQKFGHVTYFWNGNRSKAFDGEAWKEVPSDVIPFEQRPWMKSAEVADEIITALRSGEFNFIRCNFANGDMVGHTGDFTAATLAIEAVDLALGRILKVLKEIGGIALITADHGNADEMFETDKKSGQVLVEKKAKTSHTLNPVPLILYDTITNGKIQFKNPQEFSTTPGLSNLAATTANLLGFEKHQCWDDSLIKFSN